LRRKVARRRRKSGIGKRERGDKKRNLLAPALRIVVAAGRRRIDPATVCPKGSWKKKKKKRKGKKDASPWLVPPGVLPVASQLPGRKKKGKGKQAGPIWFTTSTFPVKGPPNERPGKKKERGRRGRRGKVQPRTRAAVKQSQRRKKKKKEARSTRSRLWRSQKGEKKKKKEEGETPRSGSSLSLSSKRRRRKGGREKK